VFNTTVEVPSLWITRGPFGSAGGVVTGSLAGQTKFTFTNSAGLNTFVNVTSGAGVPIDRLAFSNFADNELDDVTVQAPEPGMSLIALLGLGCVARRPRRTPAAAV
jgi:hypothetical protein